jgi:hypothetical protein
VTGSKKDRWPGIRRYFWSHRTSELLTLLITCGRFSQAEAALCSKVLPSTPPPV